MAISRVELDNLNFDDVSDGTRLAPIHPGDILLHDFMEPMGVTQHRLAVTIGVPPRRINEIVHNKRAITADTALRLARFFGTTPEFWAALQSAFDVEAAREKIAKALAAIPRFNPVRPSSKIKMAA